MRSLFRIGVILFFLFSTPREVLGSAANVSNQDNKIGSSLMLFSQNLDHHKICNRNIQYAWCIPSDYDKDIEPWKYRNGINGTLPWKYEFNFHIFDVQEVDDRHQSLTLDMYFDMRWFEPRLMLNITSDDWVNEEGIKGFISIPLRYLEHLWYPDLELYRMIQYQSQSIVKPMASLKINKMGVFRHNARVKVKLSCHMDFKRYPFDSHQCPFRVGSFYHHNETVDCTSTFFYSSDNQRTLQYMIRLVDLSNELRSVAFLDKYWATCGFNIDLTRIRAQILCQVYLTTILLVIASWISFTVDSGCIPGRMGLLVTVLLVIINLFIGVRNSSPESNGLNAIDIFLIVCIGEVFAALLEYAVVLRNTTKLSDKSETNPVKLETKPASKLNGWILEKTVEYIKSSSRTNLDTISLYLFPVSFISFLVYYLNYFLI